jgi:hypothetical protein
MSVTLEQIKNHMVNYFSDMYSDDNKYYDEDGHCGGRLLAEIKEFWNRFSTDKDFFYVISGKYMSDDIDLDGARDYFFSSSGVIPILFDYLYNTLGYSEKLYRDCIWNSIGLTDDLLDMYDNPAIIREIIMASILDEDNTESKTNGKIVLKYPAEMKTELDNNPLLKFIGLSKIDNQNPIYSMDIPKGYTIVSEINEILKCK